MTTEEFYIDWVNRNAARVGGKSILDKREVIQMLEDYHEQQVKTVDLADVGGSLRELAYKYEMDALNRYETGDHALSHIHMAAQARYGFEDGWEAAKKQ